VYFESFFVYYCLGDFLLDCEGEFEECFVGKLLVAGNKRKEFSEGNFVIVDVVNQYPQLPGIFTDNV
jgi:hypothetical protein